MTKTPSDPIDSLKGQELQLAIAKVLGYTDIKPFPEKDSPLMGGFYAGSKGFLPDWHESITFAWDLWNRMASEGWGLDLHQQGADPNEVWINAFRPARGEASEFIPTPFGARGSPPLVICRTFLKAERMKNGS